MPRQLIKGRSSAARPFLQYFDPFLYSRVLGIGNYINDTTRAVNIDGDGLFGTDIPQSGRSSQTGLQLSSTIDAQTFTPSISRHLSNVTFYAQTQGSPTDNVIIELRSDSSGNPGTVLASNSVTATGYAANTPVTVSFDYYLIGGTKYWISFRRSGSTDVINYINIYTSSVAATTSKQSTNSGSSWSTPVSDGDYYIEVNYGNDSSYGLWRSTTNLVTNGGFETDTSGGWSGNVGTETLTRVTTQSKFGFACLSVVTPGNITAEGVIYDNATVTAVNGSTYTASSWVLFPNGATFEVLALPSSASPSGFTGTGTWQRVSLTFTANANTDLRLLIRTATTAQAITFYVDGAQIEQQPYATPYVDTNGSSASRSQSYVNAPTSVLASAQAWIAARVRVEFDPSNTTDRGILGFVDAFNIYRSIKWVGASGLFRGTFGIRLADKTWSLSKGDTVTVIIAWTPVNCYISVNGSAFVASDGPPASMSSTRTFAIGSLDSAGTTYADSEFLWVATGTGTLSDADALTIHNFGDAGSVINYPSASAPTFYWPADIDVWYVPTVTSGTLQTTTLSASPSHPIGSFIRLPNKIISAAPSNPVTTKVLSPNKILSISSSQTTSKVLFPSKTLSSTGEGSSTKISISQRLLSALGGTNTASFVRLPQKILSVTGQGSVSVSPRTAFKIVLSAASTSISTMIRIPQKILAITGGSVSTGFTNNAEGGTSGTTPTTSDTGSGNSWTAVNKGANSVIDYSNAFPAHGTLGYRLGNHTATSEVSYLSWDAPAAVTESYGRRYIYFDGSVSTGTHLAQWRSGTTVIGTLTVTATDKLAIQDSAGTNQFISTTSISSGQQWRVEHHVVRVDASNWSIQAKLYSGDSLTLTEDSGVINSAVAATNFLTTRIGRSSAAANWPSATTYIYIDDINEYATSWPGPALGNNTSTSVVLTKISLLTLSVVGQGSAAILKDIVKILSSATSPVTTKIIFIVKNLSASSNPVTSFVRLPQKIFPTIIGQGSATINRTTLKTFPTLTGQGSSSVVKTPLKILSVVGQGSVSIIKSLVKIFSSIGQGSTTFSRSLFKILAASPSHPVASIVNFVSRTLSVIGIPTAILIHLPQRTLSVIGQGSASLLRTPQRIFSAVGQGSSSFIRTPLKILSVIGQGSSTKIISALKTFATSNQGTASFSSSLSHIFSINVFQVASFTRIPIRTLLVVGQGAALIVKLPQRILSAIGQGAAIIVKLPNKNLLAIGQGSAILTTIKLAALTLSAAGQGAASIVKDIFKNFSVTRTPSASFIRFPLQNLLATSNPIVSLSKATTNTFSVVGQGSAFIVKSVLRAFSVVGQGITSAFNQPQRTLSSSGQGSASIVKMPIKILSVTGQGSVTVINLVNKIFLVIGQGSADFSTATGASATFAATGLTETSIIKTPLFHLLVVGNPIASMSSSISKTWSAIGNTVTSLNFLPQKHLSVIGQGSSTFSRTIMKIFIASTSPTVTFIRSVVNNLFAISNPIASINFTPQRIFSIIGQGSSTIVKLPAKIFAAIGQGSTTLDIHTFGSAITFSVTVITSSTFVTSVRKNLSAVGNTTSSIIKLINRTLLATGQGSTTTIKTPKRTLSTIGQAGSSLIRMPLKKLLAIGNPTVSFSRVLSKSYSVSVITVSTLSRIPARIFAVIGQGSAFFSKRYPLSLSAVAQGSASFYRLALKNFVVATNSVTTFVRTLNKNFNIVTIPQTVLNKTVFRIFNVVGQGSAVFEILRHVPIIRGFFTATLGREGYYRSYITKAKSIIGIERATSDSFITSAKPEEDITREGYSDPSEM